MYYIIDTGDKTRMKRIGRNRTLLTNPKISINQILKTILIVSL